MTEEYLPGEEEGREVGPFDVWLVVVHNDLRQMVPLVVGPFDDEDEAVAWAQAYPQRSARFPDKLHVVQVRPPE